MSKIYSEGEEKMHRFVDQIVSVTKRFWKGVVFGSVMLYFFKISLDHPFIRFGILIGVLIMLWLFTGIHFVLTEQARVEELREAEREAEKECEICGGTGEVSSMEQVWADEPHMADVGTRKCICQIEN